LADAGVSIYKIKDFAGHSSITTTEQYIHSNQANLRSVRNVVENEQLDENILPFNLK